MPLVSVIVPVYNTEKYLRKCLDSLINQTLRDIEIILIDDGSTDGSCKIIEEFEQKYPEKVKCYHQKIEVLVFLEIKACNYRNLKQLLL